jgi:hypothetical protein
MKRQSRKQVMTAYNEAGGEIGQAPKDAVSRQREMILRCIAKTNGPVGIDVEQYVRRNLSGFVLNPLAQASGAALPLETGIRLRFVRRVAPTLLFAALVAAATVRPGFYIESILLVAIALFAALPSALSRFLTWRAKLDASSTALPMAGARLLVDSKYLTVGERSIPWHDLGLEAVETRAHPFLCWIVPYFLVDLLRLTSSKGPIVLDVCLIKNGQAVIDAVCDNIV